MSDRGLAKPVAIAASTRGQVATPQLAPAGDSRATATPEVSALAGGGQAYRDQVQPTRLSAT